MAKKKPTAGERMIASAKQALAFARGEESDCVVHSWNLEFKFSQVHTSRD